MKLIVGLGNIGQEYEHTRHNAGFDAIDRIEGLQFNNEKKFNAYIAIKNINDEKVIFAKPTTFMNLSGQAVAAIVNYYHIDINDILVLHDDMDTPVGKIRIRESGSNGGQKGMGNIIDMLHTQNIKRIRIGIGRSDIPVVDYVLGKVSFQDREIYTKSLQRASEAAYSFACGDDIQKVMNKYNANQ